MLNIKLHGNGKYICRNAQAILNLCTENRIKILLHTCSRSIEISLQEKSDFQLRSSGAVSTK